MTHPHQPDPEFVSNLEWQVKTALRRERRFAEPVHASSGGRMQIATLVLVSALFGAGGVVVKDEVQENRRQEILLAEVAAEQRLAAMELEVLRSRVEEAERMVRDGLASEESVRSARLRLREVEIRISRLMLDEEEIRLTGRKPDDGFSAPLAGRRDFVMERQALEASLVADRREAVTEELARLRELRRDGLVGEEAVIRARSEEDQLSALLQEMVDRLELRRQVVGGEVTGQEAEARMEVKRIRTELTMLLTLREEAWAQLGRAEAMVEAGTAPESYLQEARLRWMELETRLELLQLKLEILGENEGGVVTEPER